MKKYNLSDLIRDAQAAINEKGDMPVTLEIEWLGYDYNEIHYAHSYITGKVKRREHEGDIRYVLSGM